ncbi:MAG: hypothetical protein Greene101449_649 [Candidatus Peregrinibacteria bacterium Greene1014_49]|nr:MAG: hypothetical protein Greene101449_649 [Candidatus Peregrinibacteria bacterium Greene1014_49]
MSGRKCERDFQETACDECLWNAHRGTSVTTDLVPIITEFAGIYNTVAAENAQAICPVGTEIGTGASGGSALIIGARRVRECAATEEGIAVVTTCTGERDAGITLANRMVAETTTKSLGTEICTFPWKGDTSLSLAYEVDAIDCRRCARGGER